MEPNVNHELTKSIEQCARQLAEVERKVLTLRTELVQTVAHLHSQAVLPTVLGSGLFGPAVTPTAAYEPGMTGFGTQLGTLMGTGFAPTFATPFPRGLQRATIPVSTIPGSTIPGTGIYGANAGLPSWTAASSWLPWAAWTPALTTAFPSWAGSTYAGFAGYPGPVTGFGSTALVGRETAGTYPAGLQGFGGVSYPSYPYAAFGATFAPLASGFAHVPTSYGMLW